jgi:hypothetical protein
VMLMSHGRAGRPGGVRDEAPIVVASGWAAANGVGSSQAAGGLVQVGGCRRRRSGRHHLAR